MRKLLYCLLLLLLFSCTSKKEDETTNDIILGWTNLVYTPEFTRVVAVNGNNILVRGSFPIDAQGNFVYNQILSFINSKVPSGNFSNCAFFDISVLDNVPAWELTQLQQELGIYGLANGEIPSDWPPFLNGYKPHFMGTQVSGHPGRFCWWPFKVAGSSDPIEKKIGQFFTDSGYMGQPGGFNFNGLVDRVDSLLQDQSTPKIIYYHCAFGKDRTGLITFGWQVKHNGKTKAWASASVDSVSALYGDYITFRDDYYHWLFP
jgi:hypothetical protein